MAELDQIIQIQLTRASTTVTTASFQIAGILAPHTAFQEASRTYTDIDAVADDFSSTSVVYTIAQKLFGQSTVGAVPTSIVVGKKQVDSTVLTPNVALNTTYTVTINGAVYNFTSDASATGTQIVEGLAAAIGNVEGITVEAADGTLSVGVETPGTLWSITTSSNLSALDDPSTQTWVDALNAFIDADNSWYALVISSHLPADVEAVSDAIATRRKIFGTSTSDVNVISASSTTDIASRLSNKDAGRTFGIYLPTADNEYPEAAWIGAQLAYTPGSNDWDFKQLSGVTVSKISDNTRAVLRAKDTNMYTTIAGVSVMQDGDMFDGKPIDEQVFIDWLYARLQEQIYFRLINTLKIPFTNAGFTIIENEIRSVLSQAEANGGIDAGWRVQSPDVLDVPENLRAGRTAGTFRFNARLAGSVRKILISGNLSV